MNISNISKLSLIIGFLLLFNIACKEDPILDPLIDQVSQQTFAETMQNTVDPSQSMITNGAEVIDTSRTEVNNESCLTKTVRWNGAYGELALLSSPDWYIGKVFTSAGIVNGSYTPFLYGTRAPICASTQLPVGTSKFTFDAQTSSYNQAINDYRNQPLTRAVPIIADYSFEKVYSAEQLGVAMKAHLKVGKWVNVSGSYDFTQNEKRTRIIIKLIQPFYKVSADELEPSDFYTVPPTIDQMREGQVDQNGLVYVSNIVYGRQMLFMLESSESEEKVTRAINAEFSFWKVNSEFGYNDENKRIFEQSNIRVLVMGGDATNGAELITTGLSGMENYINRGANFDPNQNPGVPLSYELKRVKDNSIFNVVIASEYKIQECELIQQPEIYTFHHSDLGPYCPPKIQGDAELGGVADVTARVRLYVSNDRELWAEIYYKVREPKADFSTAEGTWRKKLRDVGPGKKITKILSGDFSETKYRDRDLGMEIYSPGGPVSKFLCVGDTKKDDLGNCSGSINNHDRSKLSIQWKPIKLELLPK